MSVDVSKLDGYSVLEPVTDGVAVSKLTAYTVLQPVTDGVAVAKTTAYTVLARVFLSVSTTARRGNLARG